MVDRREFLRMLGLAPAVPAVLALPMPGLVPTKPIDRHDWRPFPASTGGYISPKLFETYASELFTEVCSGLKMARRITMNYEDRDSRQGDTVNIPFVSARCGREADLSFRNVPITLEHHIEATNRISVSEIGNHENRRHSMWPIAEALAQNIDEHILDLRCEFYAHRPIRVRRGGPSDGMIDTVHERFFLARVPIGEQKYLVVDQSHYNELGLKKRVIKKHGHLVYKGIEIFRAPMYYSKLQLAFTRRSMILLTRKLELPPSWALYPNRGQYDMMYATSRESHALGFGMRIMGIQSPKPGLSPKGDFLMIHAEVLYGVGVLREEEGVQVIV